MRADTYRAPRCSTRNMHRTNYGKPRDSNGVGGRDGRWLLPGPIPLPVSTDPQHATGTLPSDLQR